ncbi:MAG: hypothetical protein NTX36_00005 [Proteobacteria bacterium]|nr:hypothetical protein [Pseudomonadota bacterium]
MALFGIKRSRFFQILQEYKKDPEGFSLDYKRTTSNNRIEEPLHENVIMELQQEKGMIINPMIPLKTYNYSYVRQLLVDKHGQKVSLPTIIAVAKKHEFFLPKRERKTHEREVLTHYVGELLQHDSSYHLFAPYAQEKWYLITTLDDYSRMILYACLIKQETSWFHILAFQQVCLTCGIPFSYYVDNHSIFRFVQGRDSMWRKHHLLTDDVDTQWRQVLRDLRVQVTYALSPQAKGKIERPYRWLQDRLVRTCAREGITGIDEAQQVLGQEVKRYNEHQLHSTTGEIPIIRYEKALREKQSLLRDFALPYPFQSVKDVFCFRLKRVVNSYRTISLNNLILRVHSTPLHEAVELRITPDDLASVYEIRIWYKDTLTDVYHVKSTDMKGVHF